MSNNKERQRNEEGGGYGTIAVIAAGAIAGIAGYFLGRNNTSPPAHQSRSRSHESAPRRSTRTQAAPPRRIPDDDTESSHNFPSPPRECCICLKNFDYIKNKGGQVHATPCGHLFCHYCIYKCLEKSSLCPTCRTHVNRDDTIAVYI